MYIHFSLKTLLIAGALLLSAGELSRIAAQQPVNELTSDNSSVITITPKRNYTGTATQTTAAGVTTTGTFTLAVFQGGYLVGSTTFNGVSTTYNGYLPARNSSDNRTRYAGYLYSFSLVDFSNGLSTNSSGRATSFTLTQLPLIVNKTAAYGGLQNEDGSVLTFRGARQTN